jgi:hypothetical protein
VKAEIAGRAAPHRAPQTEAASFAQALEVMTMEDRKAALDNHYGARKKNTWTKAKGVRPSPETFKLWLDAVFPDRGEIGMVLSDLKHLDPPAYEKVMYWSRTKTALPKETIDSFGFILLWSPCACGLSRCYCRHRAYRF